MTDLPRFGAEVRWASKHPWYGAFREYTGRVVAIVHPNEDALALLPEGGGRWRLIAQRKSSRRRVLVERATRRGVRYFAIDLGRLRQPETEARP